MTPAEATAFREISSTIGSMAEDLAQCAQAVAAQAEAQESLQAMLESLASKFVDMHDAFRENTARLNAYLDEAAKTETNVRRLEKHVSEVREKLKVCADGQR